MERVEPLDEDFRAAGMTGLARNYPRSEAAFRCLCAFNGVEPESAPETWRYAPNAHCQAAWERVVDAARTTPV